MRWLVTLQVALGLAALFGLAHKSVDSVVGPVLQTYAENAARSDARAAAAHLSRQWEELLDEQRRVTRDLAETQAFATLGGVFGRGKVKTRGLSGALEAAVAQAGGVGRVALIGPDKAPLVESEGAALLAATLAGQAALAGSAGVRLEKVEGVPNLVSARPLGDRESPAGALVVTTPLDTNRLREMTQVLPAGTLVAVALGGQPVVQTVPNNALQGPIGKQAILQLGEEAFALALQPGSGGDVAVLGLAPVRGEGAVAAVQQVQLLVTVLGGLAFFLVVVVMMLAPAPAPAGASMAPAEAVAEAPEASDEPAEADKGIEFPEHPVPAANRPTGTGDFASGPPAREGERPLEQTFAQKTLPNHPAPASAPVPTVSSPSQDLKAPPGGGLSPFAKPTPSTSVPAAPPPEPAPPPVAPPAMAPPAPAPAPTLAPEPVLPRPSAIQTNPPAQPAAPIPAPSFAPRPAAQSASPFDAIASAAVSRPPPVAPTAPPAATEPPPPNPLTSSGEDLPAPKGGVPPEVVAAERAQQQRAAHTSSPTTPQPSFGATPYDPELPAPKAPGGGVAPPTEAPQSPATEPPRQPPGATQPPQSAIPLPGASAPPQKAKNPWENPSIPSMAAPSRPPAPTPSESPSRYPPPAVSSTTLPAVSSQSATPFDESHYRSVYNEFVSSKAQLGESVDNITYEGFRTKLRTSEQALLDRHGCRAVRFQVLVKDKTVSLRPQLVR